MTRATWTLLVASLAASLGVGRAARAQGTCTATVGTKCTTAITLSTPNASSITNPKVVTLTASPTAGTWTVGAAALDAGTSNVVPVTLTVSANRSWTVSLNGASAWTVSNGGSATKLVSDVRWSTTSTGTGTPLSSSAVTVATGAAGSAFVHLLYFRTVLSWATDVAGTYVIPLSFTVTSP